MSNFLLAKKRQKLYCFNIFEVFMGHISGNTHTQEQLEHYADQNNPNNDEYWHSRGEERPE
jgi:hypothetical protein